MIYKIFILGGILLGSILVIENIVTGLTGYLFLSTGTNLGLIIFISIIIGIFIGYGIKGFLEKDDKDDENYDF